MFDGSDANDVLAVMEVNAAVAEPQPELEKIWIIVRYVVNYRPPIGGVACRNDHVPAIYRRPDPNAFMVFPFRMIVDTR
jgi:hypothetical protein